MRNHNTEASPQVCPVYPTNTRIKKSNRFDANSYNDVSQSRDSYSNFLKRIAAYIAGRPVGWLYLRFGGLLTF